MKTELQKLQDDIFDWQCKTFPASNAKSKLIGAGREIKELIKFPGDHMEWADVLVFLLGAAKHYGYDISDLVRFTAAKMAINRKRKWGKPDKHGVHHHV